MTLNNFLILTINAIAHALGFSTLLYNLCDLLAKKKLKIVVLAPILCVIVLFTSLFFEAYILLVLLVASLIILTVYGISKTYTILSCIITVAVCYINTAIINFIYYAMNIPVERIPELRASISYNFAMSIIYVILSFLCVLIIKFVKRKTYGRYDKQVDMKNGFLYIILGGVLVLSSLTAAFVMFTISIGTDNIRNYLISCDISTLIQIIYLGLVCIFCVFSILVIYSSYKLTRQKIREVEYKKDQEITLLYKKEIQSMYDEISDFKHDYMKIYSAMSIMIANGKLEELKEYFSTEITPLKEKILSEKAVTHNLILIEDIIIQGLVYTYALKACNNNIKFYIGINESVPRNKNISSLDLSRILGILLDNAFEEIGDDNNGTVQLTVHVKEEETVYQVKNTCNSDVSIQKILLNNISTKGEGRGRGLKILKSICDNYKDVLFNVNIDSGYFIAQVAVKN